MRIDLFNVQGVAATIQQSALTISRDSKIKILTLVATAALALLSFVFVANALYQSMSMARFKPYTKANFSKLSFGSQNASDVKFLKKHLNMVLPSWMSFIYDARILREVNTITMQWNKRGVVVENLMKIDDFENLPILNIGNGKGSGSSWHMKEDIDFLNPNDLSAPLMKGLDKANRPFLAFRLQDRTNSQTFVYTLFQDPDVLDHYHDEWRGGSNYKDVNDLFSGIVYTNPYTLDHPRIEELKVLSQIIHHQHSRFFLV